MTSKISMWRKLCVCMHVFLKDTHIHTHTPVCTGSLSLELMRKKLVATKCCQRGNLVVNREGSSFFTVCIPFSSSWVWYFVYALPIQTDKIQNKINVARHSCKPPVSSLNELTDTPINLIALSARNTVKFQGSAQASSPGGTLLTCHAHLQ